MEIESIFVKGVSDIRLKEHEVAQYSEEQYLKNLDIIREKVSVIVANKKGKDNLMKKICMITTVSLTLKVLLWKQLNIYINNVVMM